MGSGLKPTVYAPNSEIWLGKFIVNRLRKSAEVKNVCF